MKATKAQYIKSFVRSMKDSYPSLTEEYAMTQLELLLKGEKPKNVIGMFIEGDLKEVTITDK